MTENELRARFAREAASWLGVNEGTAKHKDLVAAYNAISPLPAGYKLKETDSWCAAFVSVVSATLKLESIVFPECSCGRMVQLYQQYNRWQEDDAYVPQIGDIIFYGWSDSGKGDYLGWPDHVGIVQSCDDGQISVIEGNYQNKVGMRRIAVNARYIRGYGLPDYASAAKAEPQKKTGFPDVPAGAWYEEEVKYMAQHGILTGYPDGTFKPQQAVTRAELTVALSRYAQAAKNGTI